MYFLRNRANADTAGEMERPVRVIMAMSRMMPGLSATAEIFIALAPAHA